MESGSSDKCVGRSTYATSDSIFPVAADAPHLQYLLGGVLFKLIFLPH